MNWKTITGKHSMRTDLYHAETKRIASEQGALLDEASVRIKSLQPLTALEQNGLLHGLQVLIENAIGKAKQQLKAQGEVVPVSAYDAFTALARLGIIEKESLPPWHGIIGLRNRIVHDYMNMDMDRILDLVKDRRHAFILDFLMTPLNGERE
ncbi:DUF86 domain-containing protein [uncultured Desulfobulbus sp.]|uniref:type VII toxin-antitoxin system HepT family RNase toxin n=1 Tax=uncultured Desulfobulbus sp. TaxID=239745 RepID=UPI0029C7B49B|nr:DUF86 domain-containing protein [uncultured Desulfobulbus sp.]